jgi:hypothetical protein
MERAELVRLKQSIAGGNISEVRKTAVTISLSSQEKATIIKDAQTIADGLKIKKDFNPTQSKSRIVFGSIMVATGCTKLIYDSVIFHEKTFKDFSTKFHFGFGIASSLNIITIGLINLYLGMIKKTPSVKYEDAQRIVVFLEENYK